jgi:hypothetical protein
MERGNILSLAAEYRELLAAHGARAVHIQDPDRILELPRDRQVLLDHAAWSCEHIPQVIDCLGGVQMCLRWIGCIQGVMAALGVMSIAETRKRMTEFAFQSEPAGEQSARP